MIVNSQLKSNQAAILANIDKDIINWVDEQVKAGKFSDRNQIVEAAIKSYKQTPK